MSVIDLFAHGAARFPDKPFLSDRGERLSYADADRSVSEFAASLHAASISPGARISVLSHNSAAAMLAILAIYRAGCVFVPLNAAFSVEEHLAMLDDLGVSALLFASRFTEVLSPVVSRLGRCSLICIDGESSIGMSREALVARYGPVAFTEPSRAADDVSAIYPTGGSTGKPKRVMHTHLTWETMAASFLTALHVDELPTYLMISPVTHAAGTFAMMLMPLGAHVIIQDGFDAGAVLDAIEREGVTHLFLPPTAIYKLLSDPRTSGRDFGSLRAFIYSAAPMSVEKLSDCISTFGPVMVQFWGQMEAPSFLTCLTVQDHLQALSDGGARLASCGRETLFTRIGVMDDAGALLAAGERGELVVRGNLVMKGYYNNPEATAEVSTFGWHHTGDLGYKDEAGYVHIVGRKSDMIISGGFNVYPVDVEQVLWGHPAVEECAVFGVPHDIWGEAVHATVQLKPAQTATPEELVAYCRERLGGIRTPKHIEIRQELPRNAVGKVDKVRLRQPFWEGRVRTI